MVEPSERTTERVDDERERAIRERAYAIWGEKGHPEGQDREHWLTAAQEYDAWDASGEGGAGDEKLSAKPPART